MTSAPSVRVAARLARREVRRRPWRTLLVALLVAFPVAGMTMAAGFVRTDRYDAAKMWETTWGSSTDVAVSVTSGDTPEGEDAVDVEAVLASLPAGSRTATWSSAFVIMRTPEKRRASAELLDVSLSGPVGADLVQVMRGRIPTAAGEVFLTRDVAKELGVELGDVLDLERPHPLSWRVVGVGERRAYWGSYAAVVGPGTAYPWDQATRFGGMRNYAIDLPADVRRGEVQQLGATLGQESLAPALRRTPTFSETNTAEVAWSWVIGAIVLTVVGIVIASAFAAGARRQLTTVGQLAANGASPSVVRQVLFLQGTWTGVIGSVGGLLLGGVGLAALAPHADRMLGRDVEPWDLRALDLVPVVLLGVLAATVAALIPARTTARIPVLAALAGRRPLAKVPRWVTGMGALASAGGLGLLGLAVLGGRAATHDTQLWALTAVLGGMGVLLGACAMTPGYTSVLGWAAARMGGTWRLAARSLFRQRTRTSAVVAGVCAASALAVGAAAMVLSIDAEDRNERDAMRRDEVHLSAELMTTTGADQGETHLTIAPAAAPRDLVEMLRAGLPGAEVLELTAVRPPEGIRWQLDYPDEYEASGDGYATSYGPGSESVAVFDTTTARVYELRDEHRSVLEKEGLLVVGRSNGAGEVLFVPDETMWPGVVPPGASGGRVVTGRRTGDGPRPSTTRHPVTVVDGRDYAVGSLPRLLVTPAMVSRLGLVQRPPLTVMRTPAPLTRSQITFVNDTVEEHRLDSTPAGPLEPQLNVFTETLYPSDAPNPLLLEAVLTLTALLFSLFVVGVSLALAAAETRDERDVLTVVGAPPKTMWGASGRKAVLLTALGSALAVPVGFLPVVVVTLASHPTPPLVFPWRITALLLIAVPLVAGLATGAASAVGLRVRPVRISTMAFD